MARKTKVVVVCDRHRSADVEAVATIEIAIDGDRRRIDVCSDHLAEFRKLTKGWSSSSRPAKKATAKRAAPSRRARSADIAAMRQWAKEHGYEISDRGRLPSAVREAYAAATG